MAGEGGAGGGALALAGCLARVAERQAQVEELVALCGEAQHRVPALFVYGNASTGKTVVVREVVAALRLAHVYVNCFECVSVRQLFELTLSGLAGAAGAVGAASGGRMGCDSLSEFVRFLPGLLDARSPEGSTTYLIFDQAEQLRGLPNLPAILSTLMRLQELTQRNVCTMLIGNVAWQTFDALGLEVYTVYFPGYSSKQLLAILCRDCPRDADPDMFRAYAELILKCLKNPCRDLNELRHAIAMLWPKYCAPVLEGKLLPTDGLSLFRAFEPHVKSHLDKLYLRQTSSAEWNQLSQNKSIKNRQAYDLPFNSKHLLLAAYIASYNPKKTDKQIFLHTKKRPRKRKSRGYSIARPKMSQHQLGPKPFALDRMLAIYFAINEECKGVVSPKLQAQVKSLLSLGLLVQTNTDILGAPQYLCMITQEDATRLGKGVGIQLTRYLADALTD